MPPVTFPLTQPQPLSTSYILISTWTVKGSHFRNVEVPGSTISPSPLRAHISLVGSLVVRIRQKVWPRAGCASLLLTRV